VKLNSKSTAAWIAMGHCFAMIEDNYQALQSYQQALGITPESQVHPLIFSSLTFQFRRMINCGLE